MTLTVFTKASDLIYKSIAGLVDTAFCCP